MPPSTDEIVRAFGGTLRRFIRRRVASEQDADDVLQETLAKVHVGLGSLEEEARLEAWLYQVARNAIADHHRSRARTPHATLPDDLGREDPPEDVAAEVASWLAPMMEALDPEDREALRLADLEGITQRELAERLGLSLSGAKSRVQRARKRLRATLESCCRIEQDARGGVVGYTPRSGCEEC